MYLSCFLKLRIGLPHHTAAQACQLAAIFLAQGAMFACCSSCLTFAMHKQSLPQLWWGVQAVQCNERIKSQAACLAAPLAKLVEEGASKLAQRANGVTALLACCHIAAASHDADQILKQNKVSCLAYSV